MTLRWLLATLHLLALPLGLAAVWARGRALRAATAPSHLGPVFTADTLWGVAALLWLGTGIPRAFTGLEKGVAYYIGTPLFHAKLGLFLVILLLELWPMVTLVRWRIGLRRGDAIALEHTRTFARISTVQAGLVVAMVFLATAIARGVQF